VFDAGLDHSRGGGIFSQGPADAAPNFFLVVLRAAGKPGVDFGQFAREPFALAGEHGAFFFRAGRAAAEHVFLGPATVGVLDHARF